MLRNHVKTNTRLSNTQKSCKTNDPRASLNYVPKGEGLGVRTIESDLGKTLGVATADHMGRLTSTLLNFACLVNE